MMRIHLSRARPRAMAVIGVLAMVALSGCVGGEEDGTGLEGLGDVEGQAGLAGLIISDEFFPVPNALIVVEGTETRAETDDAGRFEIYGLTPGDVTLNVTAQGYEPLVETATVPPEGVAEIQIVMTGVPGVAPYYLTIPFSGFTACDFSVVYSAGPTPGGVCPFGDRASGTSVQVDENWRAGVHETVWESNEEMIMASSLADSCLTGTEADPCPYLGWGKSPIRVFARPNDPEYAAQHAIDGEAMWPEGAHESFIFASYSGYFRTEINQTAYPVCVIINNQFSVPEHWGCPFGVGYATGLRFDMYHTTFYNEEPISLEGFSALPDG